MRPVFEEPPLVTQQAQTPLTRRERRQLERQDRPLRDRSRASTRRAPKRPAWQSPFVLVSVAALVVAAVIIVINLKPAPPTSGGQLFTPPLVYGADIVEGDLMGRADAPVLMEVWSDFQCPVCGRLVREQYATLKTQFVETGILRIQARDIAFLGRPASGRDESLELAAGARCAAEQNRYWQFHDFIFWNQGGENVGDYTEAYLSSIATRSGVDKTAWDACMAKDDGRTAIQAATRAALGRGINSTPTISINGSPPVAGLPNLAQLVAQIQGLASGAASPVPTATP